MIELTIKRTNGKIEKVQREGGITNTMFTKMQEATKKAGRGELLSFEVIDTRTDEEKEALAKQDAIESIKHKMNRCRDYDNQKYIALRSQLETLKYGE